MKFIRVNGRVIPIRDKKTQEQYRNQAKADFNGAVASNVGGGFAGLASLPIAYDKKNTDFAALRVKYSSMFKQAGSPKIFTGGKIAGGFADIANTKMGLHPRAGEAIFLHEMGHLKATKSKYSIHRLLRKQAKFTDRLKRAKKISKINTLRSISIKLSKPFFNPIIEAEASFHAVNEARKVSGNKASLKILSKLALPYASYALAGASVGLAIKSLYNYGKSKQKQ